MLHIFLFILAYFGCALAGYCFWYLKAWQKFLFVCLLVVWLIFGHINWPVIFLYIVLFVGAVHGFNAVRHQIKEELEVKQQIARLHAGELTIIQGGKQ